MMFRDPTTSATWDRPMFATSRLYHLLLFLFLCNVVVGATPHCLRFADANTINQAFIDGGPGKKVFLCPSKSYRLRGSIIFTAADQEIATLGYPTGPERATILVAGDFATAIQGDCRRCARVKVSSLIVDGSRRSLGRIADTGAATGLVVIGGNDGQTIRDCWIRDPRGFTAIHVREGDNLDCKNALIEKNEIGPVGEEFNPEVDGPDPETSPIGRPLADGISIACKDSVIRDNTFHDNSDAAIVVYCSPGTLVHANAIAALTMSSMAGILMVDATPFDGNYEGTIVRGNVIDAQNRIIRVGIGIGSAVWSDDTETILTGGQVVRNGLRGKYMGFGIAAAGLDKWVIKDNWDEANHIGVRSDRCFDEPINPDPMSFVATSLVQNSELQEDFTNQEFEYIVCIDEPSGLVTVGSGTDDEALQRAQIPQRAPPEQPRESIEVVSPIDHSPEPIKQGFMTGSEVMDEILEHSQQRMLDAIDAVGRRVDVLAEAAASGSPGLKMASGGPAALDPVVGDSLAELQARIDRLETRQHALLETATTMRKTIKAWDQQLSNMNEWQYDVLLDVSHRLNSFVRHAKSDQSFTSADDIALSNKARFLESLDLSQLRDSEWSLTVRGVLFLGIVGLLALGARQRWNRRNHGKIQ